MFGLWRRVKRLEESSAHKTDHDHLNQRYWDLRHDMDLLLEHLKVNIRDVPSRREIVQKGGPEKGRPN
jgi:hypothetical protein